MQKRSTRAPRSKRAGRMRSRTSSAAAPARTRWYSSAIPASASSATAARSETSRSARSSPATAPWSTRTRPAPSSRSSACSPTRSGRCSSPGRRGRTHRPRAVRPQRKPAREGARLPRAPAAHRRAGSLAGLRLSLPGGERARREEPRRLPQGERRMARVPRGRVRPPARASPSGVSPDDVHAACMVELTRRRALDMR